MKYGDMPEALAISAEQQFCWRKSVAGMGA